MGALNCGAGGACGGSIVHGRMREPQASMRLRRDPRGACATALEAAGLRTLADGQQVTFELKEDRGRSSATALKLA